MPLLMAQEAHYDILGGPATRHDLDAMIANRPIAMMSPDLHTVWANTAALEAAGLLHGASMPHGHEVVMGADGLATGELREFEAFGPVIAYAGEGRINLGIATGEEPDPRPNAAERAADKTLLLRGWSIAPPTGSPVSSIWTATATLWNFWPRCRPKAA
ncbi:amidohydrolase family protein [Paracoccus cavernae]|uniref:Amidohydrolase family protein n=2 Tax=Paracoccus cavernae TaxID=1571207 RepID=A0ABT8D7S2_9RHOB|nr:amidohydrolase family protein [Paracoccus cavernae]